MSLQRPKRLLVIDDEAHIRRVIELKFRGRGFEVASATDGAQGYDLLLSRRPDVVITDINMPHMDGQTFCRRIEPLKRERPFLTLVLTARLMPREQAWVDRLTDTHLMTKPFSPSKVLNLIESYFESLAA